MAKKARRWRRKTDPSQPDLLAGVPMIKAAKQANAVAIGHRKRHTADRSGPSGVGTAPSVLTALEAARYLNLSIATLKLWRAKKTGPAFVKRGARLIGYLPADLDAYLKSDR